MEEILTSTSEHSDSLGSRWWSTPGSLRSRLLRSDGQVGAVVNTKKHVIDSGMISGKLAGQLERIALQMGLSLGNGGVEQSGGAPVFEPVKPDFTREVGSFQRQVTPHAVRDPGE